MFTGGDDGRIGRRDEAPGADRALQRKLSGRLVKGQTSGIHGIDSRLAAVIADHAGPSSREGDGERQPSVTAAPDNHHVARETRAIVRSPSGHESSP
jgi:hypothetical protein